MASQEAISLQQRAVGAYLGLAVGDALGATVEFMTPREIATVHGVHKEIVGGGWLKLKAGRVTDDTEMSLALGDAILGYGPHDAAAVARSFDNWMRSRPVDIGNTVRRGIITFRKTGATEAEYNEYDAGNGALMRLLPTVLATYGHDTSHIDKAITTQAYTTHNHPYSDAACRCVTQMIHQTFVGTDKVALIHGPVKALWEENPQYNFRKKREENPSGFVVETLRAVFQAFFDTDTFEECLIDVVNRGGDADTTGAIAGMIAGAYFGEKAIPNRWLDALDGDVYNQCREQALALLRLAKSPTA